MGICQRTGDGFNQRYAAINGHLSVLLQDVLQGSPLNHLHDHVIAIFARAEVMNADDVWMLQARNALRLFQEPGPKVLGQSEFGTDELDCPINFQIFVESLVDFSHATTTKTFSDLVRADDLTDQVCHETLPSFSIL